MERVMQLNQSSIINIQFISSIEYTTRECHLSSPFDKMDIPISKGQLSEIRKKYDRL